MGAMRGLALALSLAAVPAGAEAPPPSLAGTWDLVWQTAHGADRKGFLVVTQHGDRLAAEIHGQGHVKAEGRIAGSRFELRGTRLAIRYTIAGQVSGGRIDGTLRILTLEKRFTGYRRP